MSYRYAPDVSPVVARLPRRDLADLTSVRNAVGTPRASTGQRARCAPSRTLPVDAGFVIKRPENLPLPGVAWGDRWAVTADCAEVAVAPASEYSALDFIAMYWFRDPPAAVSR